GRRRAALEILWSQRCLAALSGDRAQRTPGAEAPGVAPGTADGAPQAFALPALQHARATASPCPKTHPASGRRGQVDGRLRGGPAVAARDHLNLPAPECRAYQRICRPPFRNSLRSVFMLGPAQPAVASCRVLQPSWHGASPPTEFPPRRFPADSFRIPKVRPLSADWGLLLWLDSNHKFGVRLLLTADISIVNDGRGCRCAGWR